MSAQLFFELRHIISSLVFAMASFLLVVPLPKNIRNPSTNKSKRLFGEAFLILPLAILMCYLLKIEDFNNPIFNITNLSVYFISITLFEAAFTMLLNPNIELINIKLKIAYCILYPTQMIAAYIYGSPALYEISTTVAVVLLFINNGYCASSFVKIYDKIDRENKYYRTVLHGIYHIMGLGTLCGTLVFFRFAPQWLNFSFLLYALWTFCYVFYSILRYFYGKSKSVENFAVSQDIIPTTESKRNKSIQINIEKWLESKSYTNKGVTIVSAAAQLGTNRTYLSNYINSIYGSSFKTWITQLRINYAKELMDTQPELSIEDLANEVGFASASSFINVFKLREGVTPHRWRSSEMGIRKVNSAKNQPI